MRAAIRSAQPKRRDNATLEINFCFLAFGLSALAPQVSAQAAPSTHRIVIAAGTVLDGKGKSLKNVRITIEGSKIVAVNPDVEGRVDYDLRGLTVLPGWIDAHVHITWIFGKDGKNAGTEGTTQEDAYKGVGLAWLRIENYHLALLYANAYRYSTKERTAPSIPVTFGLVESIK